MNARQDIGAVSDRALDIATAIHTTGLTAAEEAALIEMEDAFVEDFRREMLGDEDGLAAVSLINDDLSEEFGTEPKAFVRLILRCAIARQRGAVESYQKACHELCQRVDDVFVAEGRRQFKRGAR